MEEGLFSVQECSLLSNPTQAIGPAAWVHVIMTLFCRNEEAQQKRRLGVQEDDIQRRGRILRGMKEPRSKGSTVPAKLPKGSVLTHAARRLDDSHRKKT